MRYVLSLLPGLIVWGSVVILGEVIKWKASEQICLIGKTIWIAFKLWMRGL